MYSHFVARVTLLSSLLLRMSVMVDLEDGDVIELKEVVGIEKLNQSKESIQ